MNTIDEMFADHLARIDAAWHKIRRIHGDIGHCNYGSKIYREALEELQVAERTLWRLKSVVADNR